MKRDFKLHYHASGSDETTTASIAAGSTTLLLDNAIDFADNHGVYIPNAGPISIIATPTASVSVGGGPRGTSTYGYRVVALDGLGGGSAASAEATITTGNATLGGFDDTGAECAQALGLCRWLSITLTPVPNANGGYAMYRTTAPAGSGLECGFIGIYSYLNAPFLDYGQAVKTPPPGVPTQPPDVPFAQSFVTTIKEGGGTKQLTLADAAVTAASGTVYHDDTDAILRAFADTDNLYIPDGVYGLSQATTFAMQDGQVCGEGKRSVIRLQANAKASLNVGASGVTVRGIAVDGQKVANTLVNVGAFDNVTVEHTWGKSALFGGINASNMDASKWAHDLLLDRNEYTDCEYGYSLFGNFDGIRITNNQMAFSDYNYSGRGISLHNAESPQGYVYPRRFSITANTVRCGNHSGGLVIQGSGMGTATGNVILASGGIFGFWAIGAGKSAECAGGWTFTGNYVESLWPASGVGINLTNVVNVTEGGNVIRGFGYAYECGGYGNGAFADSPANAVRMTGDTLLDINDGEWCGAKPQSVIA